MAGMAVLIGQRMSIDACHILIAIGPVSHLDLDGLRDQPGLAHYQVARCRSAAQNRHGFARSHALYMHNRFRGRQ
jgi:hypothetical protein